MSDTRFLSSLRIVLPLTMMVFFVILPRLLLAPLLLRIATDLGITYDAASAIFLTAAAGFVIGLLTSGLVSHAITHRWTVVASVGACGVGLISLSFARTPLTFHLLVFLISWATGLYPGSGIASLTSLVPAEHRGKSLSIHESGPNTAFILAPILAAALAPVWGWRGVMQLAGVAALVATVAFVIFGRALDEPGEPPRFASIGELLRNRSFWVVSLLFVIAMSAAVGVYSVLPTYLIVDHGLDERFVNTLIGASRISAFLAILTAGELTDRFGFRKVVTAIIVVTGTATIAIGLTSGALLVVSVFVQPMIVGAFFPAGLTALSSVTSPARRNLAVALAIPMANVLGSGLAPRLLSAAGAAGHFGTGFVVVGSATLASLFLLLISGRRK